MSTSQRKIAKTILEKNLRTDDADEIENAIYDMCKKLCKNKGLKVTDEYPSLAYEKIGDFLAKAKNISDDEIFLDLKNNIQGYDSSAFKQESFDYKRFMDRSVQKPTAVKGLYTCKAKGCGSDEFYTWSAQTRSNDEGATIYRQCSHCGKRGKES